MMGKRGKLPAAPSAQKRRGHLYHKRAFLHTILSDTGHCTLSWDMGGLTMEKKMKFTWPQLCSSPNAISEPM